MAGVRPALLDVLICTALCALVVPAQHNGSPLASDGWTKPSSHGFRGGRMLAQAGGRVVAWGGNQDVVWEYAGQATIPPAIAALSNVVAVAAGEAHSLALLSTGEVRAWGSNSDGQTDVPPSLTGQVVGITAGGNFSVALLRNGTVRAWGYNGEREVAVPQGLANVQQVSSGCFHTLALLSNGTVSGWGYNGDNEITPPPGLSDVVEVSAGCWHSLARLRNGTVVAWGLGLNGRTSVPPGLPSAKGIAGGRYHSLAVSNWGTVTAWGYSGSGQAAVPQELSNVAQVAAGGFHSLALLSNGSVVGWGSPLQGQLAVPPEASSRVLAIAAGWIHSLAIVAVDGSSLAPPPPRSPVSRPPPAAPQLAGSVASWGGNSYEDGTYAGQSTATPAIAAFSNIVAVAAGEAHSLALLSTGIVVGWGSNLYWQSVMPSWITNVVAIAAGSNFSLALRGDGTVAGWGNNGDGQLTMPRGLTNVVQVTAGCFHAAALLSNGSVVAWGSNLGGQAAVPAGLTSVVEIAAGCFHTLARLSDGTVTAWGFNSYNQTSVPAGLSNVQSIAAGRFHSIAVSNGQVVAWGIETQDQQINAPIQALSNVVKVAAGGFHSMALLNTGEVVAWGYDGDGQTNVPSRALSNVFTIAAGLRHSLAIISSTPLPSPAPSPPPSASPSPSSPPLGPLPPSSSSSPLVASSPPRSAPTSSPPVSAPTFAPPLPAPFLSPPLSATTLSPPLPAPIPAARSDDGSSSSQRVVVAAVVGVVCGLVVLAIIVAGIVWYIKKYHPKAFRGAEPGDGQGPQQDIRGGVSATHMSTTGTTGKAASTTGNPWPPPGMICDGLATIVYAPTGTVEYPNGNTTRSAMVSRNGTTPSGNGTASANATASANGTAPSVGIALSPRTQRTGSSHPRSSRKSAEHQSLSAAPRRQPSNTHSSLSNGSRGASPFQLAEPAAAAALLSPPSNGGLAAARNSQGSHGIAPQSPQRMESPASPPSTATHRYRPWAPPAPLLLSRSESRELPTHSYSYMPSYTSTASYGSTAMEVTRLIWERKLSNLKIAWEDIDIDEKAVLGQGGFGTVWKGMWQGTIPVAVKTLKLEKLTPHALDELRREALIMCDMHHPAIAPVYGLVDDGVHHALVMRLYKRGSVAAAIKRKAYANFGLVERLQMAQQVASGMRSLHERKPAPIIHGDLKTSNLLVDDDGKSVVIADFGLACCLREGQLGQVVESGALSVGISPPEVLESPIAPRTTAGDVYAFGILLMEITTGRPAFKGMRLQEVMRAVRSGGRPSIPPDVPPSVASIITACWAQDAFSRPEFSEVVASLGAAIMIAKREEAFDVNNSGGTNTTLADLTADDP